MHSLGLPFIDLLLHITGFQLLYFGFKQTVIHLLLKKSVLDTTEIKNFRPVSNLLFPSKLLERIVHCGLSGFFTATT